MEHRLIMKDKFTEDVIKKEKNDGNIMIIIFFILLAIILFFLNLMQMLIGGYVLCAVSGFLAYYFASKQNVEYEFSMTNEHVEVDAIYNKQKRSHVYTFNLQEVIVAAPYNSVRLEHERSSKKKTYYFVSGLKDQSAYSLIGEFGGIQTEIVLEPTDKILDHIKYICKDTFYEE